MTSPRIGSPSIHQCCRPPPLLTHTHPPLPPPAALPLPLAAHTPARPPPTRALMSSELGAGWCCDDIDCATGTATAPTLPHASVMCLPSPSSPWHSPRRHDRPRRSECRSAVLLRKGPSGFPQERRDHDRRRVSCCRGTLPAFPESTLLPPSSLRVCGCVWVRACACVRTRGYASLVTQASKSGGRPLRPLADLSSNDERPSAGYGIHRDPGGPMVQAASAQAPAQWCMRRGPRRMTHGACLHDARRMLHEAMPYEQRMVHAPLHGVHFACCMVDGLRRCITRMGPVVCRSHGSTFTACGS